MDENQLDKGVRMQIRNMAGTYIRTGLSILLDHAEQLIYVNLGRGLKMGEFYPRGENGQYYILLNTGERIPVRDQSEAINRMRYLSILLESGIAYEDLVERLRYDINGGNVSVQF